MLPRFATDRKHRWTQCCRHNVLSFCRPLNFRPHLHRTHYHLKVAPRGHTIAWTARSPFADEQGCFFPSLSRTINCSNSISKMYSLLAGSADSVSNTRTWRRSPSCPLGLCLPALGRSPVEDTEKKDSLATAQSAFFHYCLDAGEREWTPKKQRLERRPRERAEMSSAIRCARPPETNGNNGQSEKQDDYPNRWTRDKWALQLIRDAVLEPNTSHIWRLRSRTRGRNGRFSVA